MVRVISEKLFSPPRSRHSSGETVDKELAARAVEVLSGLNSRRFDFSDYESSSDSHWDSEVDIEGDGAESGALKDLTSADGKGAGSDILRKRKERRRERNKLSAQAYRVRRKEQTVKQQTVLKGLQDENTRLKTTVNDLEEQLKKVRHCLRQRHPATFTPSTPATATATSTLSQDTASEAASATYGPASPGWDKAALVCPPSTETLSPTLPQTMDNDQSHRQQVSPVVDNFLFSTKAPATPSNPSPLPFPKMSGVPNFSFLTAPVGGRPTFNNPSFVPTPLPTISEKPDVRFLHRDPPSQRPQHADLNANTNSQMFTNANMNANANMFGMFQNNNRIMNNNNNLFRGGPTMGQVEPRADLHQKSALKFLQV